MGNFAVRLKELRTKAGLTQQELAEKAGLHTMSVTKLELQSREPSWKTVEALATALGVECTAFSVKAKKPAPVKRGRPAGKKKVKE